MAYISQEQYEVMQHELLNLAARLQLAQDIQSVKVVYKDMRTFTPRQLDVLLQPLDLDPFVKKEFGTKVSVCSLEQILVGKVLTFTLNLWFEEEVFKNDQLRNRISNMLKDAITTVSGRKKEAVFCLCNFA